MDLNDVTPTDSTFQDKRQTLCNETRKQSSSVLLFEVKGHGVLRLLSWDGKQDKKDSPVDHNLEIEMSLKTQHLPIVFHIPNDEKLTNIRIQREGQIDVKLNGFECNPADDKEVIDIDDVDNRISGETNKFIHGTAGPAKGHRRNDSSHLYVSGEMKTVIDTENKLSNHGHTDSSHIKELDNAQYKAPSDNSNDPTELEEESSNTPSEQLSMLSSLNCKSNIATDDVVREISKGNLVTTQEQVAQHSEHIVDGNSPHSEQSKIKELQNEADTNLTEDVVNGNNGPLESRNGSTIVRDKVRLSRLSDETKQCDNVLRDTVQMKGAIQASYTYLLDMIDLMDLCDYLYQNRVLDIGIYQTLFDMSYERVHLRNAKRTLLLHLSRRQVKKESMIKSLDDSAHYQLIPYFFPSE